MNTNQAWIDKLKIAVINNNINDAIKHIKKIPKFETIEESQTALALIARAKEIAIDEQNKIGSDMAQIKQTKKYFS
jgi:predicted oxidoreductase